MWGFWRWIFILILAESWVVSGAGCVHDCGTVVYTVLTPVAILWDITYDSSHADLHLGHHDLEPCPGNTRYTSWLLWLSKKNELLSGLPNLGAGSMHAWCASLSKAFTKRSRLLLLLRAGCWVWLPFSDIKMGLFYITKVVKIITYMIIYVPI